MLPAPRGVRTVASLQKYVEQDLFGIFSSRVTKRVRLQSGNNPPVVLNADPDAASPAEPDWWSAWVCVSTM